MAPFFHSSLPRHLNNVNASCKCGLLDGAESGKNAARTKKKKKIIRKFTHPRRFDGNGITTLM